MDVPFEIDPRLVEVTRRAAPHGPVASPAFATALLRTLAEIAAATRQPEAGVDGVGDHWVTMAEGKAPELLVECRVEHQGDLCVATVPGRIGVRVRFGEAPRVVGVMVLTPWREDTLQPLSIVCLVDDGETEYRWQFGRDGRVYTVTAWQDGERWLAMLNREPLPIELEDGPRLLARVTGATPAQAFARVVPAMPPPRLAVAGALPRHGLGID